MSRRRWSGWLVAVAVVAAMVACSAYVVDNVERTARSQGVEVRQVQQQPEGLSPQGLKLPWAQMGPLAMFLFQEVCVGEDCGIVAIAIMFLDSDGVNVVLFGGHGAAIKIFQTVEAADYWTWMIVNSASAA